LPTPTQLFGISSPIGAYPFLPFDFIESAGKLGYKISISSISLVEVVYLAEKGRISSSAYAGVMNAFADPGHVFVESHVSAAIAGAMRSVSRTDVPDMPDRIVAATALYLDVPVISRDSEIRAAKLRTIW
jgi:predicted nucleic acid-binding protein